MKKIYSSLDSVQVGVVTSLLDTAGIAYEMRNESMSQVLPTLLTPAEVWVAEEAVEEAKRLIATASSPLETESAPESPPTD
ncbi:MAG TPA: DUF2007 domain-containing protein [Candidatus Saccharimonadales bacterium]|jgi:Putative prokaryotic signal transducing protein|nr:DUF2007 domain-containing protein [Candidatus Saccharimonadales bacterium]